MAWRHHRSTHSTKEPTECARVCMLCAVCIRCVGVARDDVQIGNFQPPFWHDWWQFIKWFLCLSAWNNVFFLTLFAFSTVAYNDYEWMFLWCSAMENSHTRKITIIAVANWILNEFKKDNNNNTSTQINTTETFGNKFLGGKTMIMCSFFRCWSTVKTYVLWKVVRFVCFCDWLILTFA